MTTKEPLIVHHEREIPQEVMWHLQDGKVHRDTTIPNRFWFRFPEHWYNQYKKDPILGIRSIYVARTIRCVSFKVTIKYWNIDDDCELYYTNPTTAATSPISFTFTTTTYLESDDTIRKACQHWDDDCKEAFTDALTEFSDCILLKSSEYSLPTMTYDIQATPYNTMIINTPANSESPTYTQDGSTVSVEQRIYIESLGDDNSKMFDLENVLTTNTTITWSILWNRYQCFVKSSISALTTDSFFGHTRSSHYNPIKYFRINTREQSFYVDLFSTYNHGAYVILPTDNLDDLIIEGIVCFDSSAII